MKRYLILTASILLLAAACGKPPVQPAQNQQSSQQATSTGETADWKIYKNTDFDFEIALTDAWKGYKVELQPMSSNFGAGTLVFKIPTKSGNYGDGSGYAEPMKISVYNKEYWDKLQNEEGPKPELLGKNSTYVFAYSSWQDPPADLINVNLELNKVVGSFKFTK